MDPEDERILYLTRAGRDKIFKHGTYNMVAERAITQDHPFYAERNDNATTRPIRPSYEQEAAPTPAPAAAPPEPAAPEPAAPPSEEDAAAMAARMISSNFKVGLSQEEVDALLNGMT